MGKKVFISYSHKQGPWVSDRLVPCLAFGLAFGLDTAIVRGHIALHELMRRESRLPREWEYLSGFRRHERLPPPTDEAVVRSLKRRLLVVGGGEWRLRVPLMGRWLRERG